MEHAAQRRGSGREAGRSHRPALEPSAAGQRSTGTQPALAAPTSERMAVTTFARDPATGAVVQATFSAPLPSSRRHPSLPPAGTGSPAAPAVLFGSLGADGAGAADAGATAGTTTARRPVDPVQPSARPTDPAGTATSTAAPVVLTAPAASPGGRQDTDAQAEQRVPFATRAGRAGSMDRDPQASSSGASPYSPPAAEGPPSPQRSRLAAPAQPVASPVSGAAELELTLAAAASVAHVPAAAASTWPSAPHESQQNPDFPLGAGQGSLERRGRGDGQLQALPLPHGPATHNAQRGVGAEQLGGRLRPGLEEALPGPPDTGRFGSDGQLQQGQAGSAAGPGSYYVTGAARARAEVFVRRAMLVADMQRLGLPAVYDHPPQGEALLAAQGRGGWGTRLGEERGMHPGGRGAAVRGWVFASPPGPAPASCPLPLPCPASPPPPPIHMPPSSPLPRHVPPWAPQPTRRAGGPAGGHGTACRRPGGRPPARAGSRTARQGRRRGCRGRPAARVAPAAAACAEPRGQSRHGPQHPTEGAAGAAGGGQDPGATPQVGACPSGGCLVCCAA